MTLAEQGLRQAGHPADGVRVPDGVPQSLGVGGGARPWAWWVPLVYCSSLPLRGGGRTESLTWQLGNASLVLIKGLSPRPPWDCPSVETPKLAPTLPRHSVGLWRPPRCGPRPQPPED